MKRLNYIIKCSIIHPDFRDTTEMNSYYDRGKKTKKIMSTIYKMLKDL